MTVGELIRELSKLPQSDEIAVNGTMAIPRAVEVIKVNEFAGFDHGCGCGSLRNPARAWLLRPAREMLGELK